MKLNIPTKVWVMGAGSGFMWTIAVIALLAWLGPAELTSMAQDLVDQGRQNIISVCIFGSFALFLLFLELVRKREPPQLVQVRGDIHEGGDIGRKPSTDSPNPPKIAPRSPPPTGSE